MFDHIIVRLAEEHPEYIIYLKDIKVKSWARHAFPVRRWLHDTSNISESINGTWLEYRELPAFNLLLSMWNWTMRYEKALIIVIFIVILKTERCTNDE